MSKSYEITNRAGVAHIRISGPISWWKNNSEEFTRQVDQMLANGCNDVDGYINSPGGSMIHANEIGNQVSRFPGKKKATLGALCASAATIVATYFDEREAFSNIQWMAHDPIHEPTIRRMADWDSERKLYENLRNDAIRQYKKVFKSMTDEEISEMMEKVTWMDATELKKKGFITKVLGESDQAPANSLEVLNEYGVKVPDVVNQMVQISTKNTLDMSKIALKLGLKADATEDEIVAAIDKREQAALKAEGNSEKGIAALVALGEKKGLKKELVEKMAKADFDTALELIQGTPDPAAEASEEGKPKPAADSEKRLSEIVAEAAKGGKGKEAAASTKSLKEMMEKEPAAAQKLLDEKPEEYIKMFTAEFGYTPKLEELKG